MPDEERLPGEATPEPEEEPKDELDDLFRVPQPEDNDMTTDHLVDLDEEEDLSDLTAVSREDVMGTPPTKRDKSPKRRYKRTNRVYPPQTSVRGVGY